MKPLKKKLTAAILSALVLAASTAPAFADSASGRAKARLAELQQHQTALTQIKSQIEAFKIKGSYCDPIHRQDKRADEEALKRLSSRAAQEMRSVSNIRRILIATITRNQAARTALDQEISGGTGTIVDGSFFRPFNNLRRDINLARSKKAGELSAAPTRPCGSNAASDKPAEPAFVVQNPLVDIVMTAEYTDVTIPTLPKQFCYEDERRALKHMLYELRHVARKNAVAARELAAKLKELKAGVTQKKNDAFKAADTAAKAGDRKTLNNQTAQMRAYETALKKLDVQIQKAEAEMRSWRGVVDTLDAERAKADGIPVVDCLGKVSIGNTIGETAFPDVYERVNNVSLKEVKLVDVNITKTCFQEVKDNFVMAASMEVSNASYNLSQWKNRLDQVGGNLDLLYHQAGVSADLISKMEKARNEARIETAKWEKIKSETKAIEEKAKAIVVENCSSAGGATEIGRLDPGFGELPGDIPVPDLKPYDLPGVPENICTWEELQALIARAATARETSAHNRSEWGKRMVALGNKLFVDNTTSNPRGPEYEALLDARAQNEYWSNQQEVAHKVYWALKEMKVSDCDKPKKTSMALPSYDGNANASAGSINDALENARSSAPTFNGGSSSNGYGPIGDGYPPVYGYPDFDKIRLRRQITGQHGFDGSEAERAVRLIVDGVERPKKHDQENDHALSDNHGRNERREYAAPNPSNVNRGGALTEHSLPPSGDVEKKPETSAVIPVPYPNTSISSDTGRQKESQNQPATDTPTNNDAFETRVGGPIYKDKTWFPGSLGVEVPRDQLTTRGALSSGEGEVEECRACGLEYPVTTPQGLDARQISLSKKAIQDRPAPTLTIPGSNNGGTMIQVAPPPLVITPQGGSARDYGSAAEVGAAVKSQN